MGLPSILLEYTSGVVTTIYYCPQCAEVWTVRGTCWCEMRDDAAPDASAWDPGNYPTLLPLPDQAAALAAYRIGGTDAVRVLASALVVHGPEQPAM